MVGVVRWTFPEQGPCVGHACDNCHICQKGHCCRKDDPDYRLPQVGDWDGPLFAPIGEVVYDSDGKAVCHACGEAHHFVAGLHAWRRHDLTGDEYKAIFGLNRTAAVASATYRNALRAASVTNKSADRLSPFQYGKPGSPLTPEQLVQYGALPTRPQAMQGMRAAQPRRLRQRGLTPLPAQTSCTVCGGVFELPVRSTGYRAQRKTCGARTCKSEAKARSKRKPPVTLTCVVCGASFVPNYRWARSQTCGVACLTALRSRLLTGKPKSDAHRQAISAAKRLRKGPTDIC